MGLLLCVVGRLIARPSGRDAGRVGGVQGVTVEGDGQGVVLGGGLGADLDEQARPGGRLADEHRGVIGLGAGDRPAQRRFDGGDLDVADRGSWAARCG